MHGAEPLDGLLARALESEREDPRTAHKLYARLWRRSDEARPLILIVSIVAPLLAAPAAFYANARVRWVSGETALLILFLGGYFVPVLLAFRTAAHRRGALDRITPAQHIGIPFFVAVFFFVETLGFFFAVGVYALAFGVPAFLILAIACHLATGSGWLTPPELVFEGVAVASLIAGLLVALSDVKQSILLLRPRAGLPELVAGLRHSVDWNLQMIAAIAIGAVLTGSGPMGLLYEDLALAMAASGIAGLFLGLSLYRQPDREELGLLAWLGLSRTEVRLGRRATARWRIRLLDTFYGKQPSVVNYLAAALLGLADPDQPRRRDPEIGRLLAEGAERAAETASYRREWVASIAAARQLQAAP